MVEKKAVVYVRVSTDEQTPKSQLQIVEEYAKSKGYEVVKVFEENISGKTNPFERPKFKEMIDFARKHNIKTILMYDLTRFYRSENPSEAISLLNKLTKREEEGGFGFFIDFAKEPEIEDPLLKELWRFIKTWFASYERAMISARTRAGMMRLKSEGKLYHRPTLLHYFASTLFNKDLSELTPEDLKEARVRFVAIVSKYWYDSRFKKHRIAEILKEYEDIFKKMYSRFKDAPTSYHAFWKVMSNRSGD